MTTIDGKNGLRLKPIRLDSAELIYSAIHASRPHLQTWLPFVDQTKSATDTKNFIKTVLNSFCPKKDKIFEIWVREQFAGLISLKEIDLYNRKAELGYWLTEQMTGKGVMTNSCRLLLHYAFHKMHMNRMIIKVAVGNTKSAAIPKKLGFTLEGIEEEGEFLHDRFVDLEVYTLLKSEYPEKWKIAF
jgi:ribosomal-protein-serine acetyltransferase